MNMNKSLLGIIDATQNFESLDILTNHRNVAALPIAGRFRLIDFILSSMVNSGISNVAVYPQHHFRSLMDHLGTGKNWDLNRKRDGLFFLPVPHTAETNGEITSLEHFSYHMTYLERSEQEYVVVANSYTVCNIDFNAVLKEHLKLGGDITEVKKGKVSLNMYVLKKDLLVKLIEERKETGYTSVSEAVQDHYSGFKVNVYEYDGYLATVDSIGSYFQTSMELLKVDNWYQLFMKTSPIYTKVKDEPPSKYGAESNVTQAMVANGCVIKGEVEHSIIFRAVNVDEGTSIKNSIIMQKTKIGKNCKLDYVILDKDVEIADGTVLIGSPFQPIVVQKGVKQGALMNS